MNQFDDENLNLEIFSEECTEVVELILAKHLSRAQQLKSKVIRFGIDDYHLGNGAPNREALELEIGHTIAMIIILVRGGTLSWSGIFKGVQHKMERLKTWYKPDV